MFYFTIFLVVLSSPTELIRNASKSSGQNNFEKAQQYLDSAKSMRMSDFEEARFFHNQGYIFEHQHKLPDALLNFHEALRHLKSSGEESDDARYLEMAVNQSIGNIYYHYNSDELAIEYYNQALELANPSEKSEPLYNIALSQNRSGSYDDAVESLLEAFKLTVNYNQKSMKAMVLIKLGAMHMESGKLEAAAKYLNDALLIDSISSDIQAKAHNNYAITSWKLGDYHTSNKHFEKAVQIGNSYFQFIALQNLCEMYLEQGILDKSIDVGSKAEELLSQQISGPENLIVYSFMANAYQALGDYQSALNYSKRFNSEMIDYYKKQQASIDTDDANRIKMVTENYELKVQQIKDRETSILINVAISSTILLTLLTLIWQQQNKKKKMVRKIEEELLA